jgi:hypothetical protein
MITIKESTYEDITNIQSLWADPDEFVYLELARKKEA